MLPCAAVDCALCVTLNTRLCVGRCGRGFQLRSLACLMVCKFLASCSPATTHNWQGLSTLQQRHSTSCMVQLRLCIRHAITNQHPTWATPTNPPIQPPGVVETCMDAPKTHRSALSTVYTHQGSPLTHMYSTPTTPAQLSVTRHPCSLL